MKSMLFPFRDKSPSSWIMYVRMIYVMLALHRFWYAILFGLLFLAFPAHLAPQIGYVVLNFVAIYYAQLLALVIHESGHYLAALMVGEKPWRITLGKGHVAAKVNFFGTKLVINTVMTAGMVHTLFQNHRYVKLRHFFYILAGPLANLLVGALCWLLVPLSFSVSTHINWWGIFFLMNMLAGIVNLFPFKVKLLGMKVNSDGLQLLKLPWKNKDELLKSTILEQWLLAYDRIEERDYVTASHIYETHSSALDAHPEQKINLGLIYLKLERFAEAVTMWEALLPRVSDKLLKPSEAVLYNNLAYGYVLLDRLEEASTYINKAIGTKTGLPVVQQTYAAVLIERGQYEEGIAILIKDTRSNFDQSSLAFNAMYLAWAYGELDQAKKSAAYWSFFCESKSKLDADTLFLGNRIEGKLAARLAIHS